MDQVIERLRKSKRQSESNKGRDGFGCDGFECGQKWARERAEAVHLERLERLRDDLREELAISWEDYFSSHASALVSAFTPGERFYFAIEPESDGDRESASAFWYKHLGDDAETAIQSDAFILGFADGALDIWMTIKDQL